MEEDGITFYNRYTGEMEREKVMGERALRWVYGTATGRLALHLLVKRAVFSRIMGWQKDRPASARCLPQFVQEYGIDMEESARPLQDFRSFNDFFTRRIRPEARPVNLDPDTLISPCDGNLSAYRISEDSEFAVKNSYYSVSDLVGGDEIAHEYLNGTCLILRLGVDNYHRYCYIDDGFKGRNHHIEGIYHTVQPIVVRKHPVFRQNNREYCMLYTKNFGNVVQIEVGACLVGRIKNHNETGVTHRGQEKGMFLFGGSTIILLFKEDVLDVSDWVFDFTAMGREIPVKYGAPICKRLIKE